MKAKISLLLSVLMLVVFSSTFAASGDESSVSTSDVSVSSNEIKAGDTKIDTSALDSVDSAGESSDIGTSETDTTSTTTASGEESGLNSAGPNSLALPKGGIGNYKEVPCDKNYFTTNSCNQCFEGGSKSTGDKITGLTDSWTNPNSTEQIIYKDEQILPEMINLGGEKTVWLSNPTEPEKFWKYSDEIVWTDSATGSGKQEFLLEGGKTTNFLEGDLGASYALQSTDAKQNDPIGLLKFSLAYHDTDESAKEGAMKNHVECVVYNAAASAPVTPAPVTPQEVTKVKTGPETIFIVLAALLLAFGLVKYKRKA